MNLLSTIMFLLYYSAALAASEVNTLYLFMCSGDVGTHASSSVFLGHACGRIL